MAGQTVFPNQFFGIEVNPRAAAIAELVLWIGALQWHYRTHGNVRPPEPIIRNFHNLECRDAVLTWDATEPVLDTAGQPVTHWDGRTTKLHPTIGLEVPDETARVPVLRYLNPRPAVWPQADFIVGSPPFIGAGPMRETLGDGYVEALRAAHADVPQSSDFVVFWWNHAASLVRAGAVQRFGLVTTNSLSQTFNRRVVGTHLAREDASVAPPPDPRRGVSDSPDPSTTAARAVTADSAAPAHAALADRSRREDAGQALPADALVRSRGFSRSSAEPPPLSLLFAIPDHPWVDSTDGAAVRIAMTVGGPGKALPGTLATVTREASGAGEGYEVTLAETRGVIHADLTVGAALGDTPPLRANSGISNRGVIPHGAGFIVTLEEALQLGLGRVAGLDRHIRPYRNGRDLTDRPRGVLVIDLCGLSAAEVRERFPEVYQWLLERVKPERGQNPPQGQA
jgi:hypothetical protein